MKYFDFSGNMTGFCDEDGDRLDRAELDDVLDEGDEIVGLKASVNFCKRSGGLELVTEYLQVFVDGSIFWELEGSFRPVEIVPQGDDLPDAFY